MNLTVSQWLQIAAIAVSAVISISRWVWDARKATRNVQTIQTASDAMLIKPRTKTSWVSQIAFFGPLGVLLWQTLSPGAITRFDFGIMIFSGISFMGFMMLQVVNTVAIILEGSVAQSLLLGKMVDGYASQVDSISGLANVLRLSSNGPTPKKENEQDAPSDGDKHPV